MSEPVSKAEIEDVLSSIRKLVSDEPFAPAAGVVAPDRKIRVATSTSEKIDEIPAEPSKRQTDASVDATGDTAWNSRFVLSPELRVETRSSTTEDTADTKDPTMESHGVDAGRAAPLILSLVHDAADLNDTDENSQKKTDHSEAATSTDDEALDFSKLGNAMMAGFQDVGSPADVPAFQRLEERAVHMETAISDQDNEWEPDGSDDDVRAAPLLLECRVPSESSIVESGDEAVTPDVDSVPELYVLGQDEAVAPIVTHNSDHAEDVVPGDAIKEETDISQQVAEEPIAEVPSEDYVAADAGNEQVADTAEDFADAALLAALEMEQANSPEIAADLTEDIVLEAGSLTLIQDMPDILAESETPTDLQDTVDHDALELIADHPADDMSPPEENTSEAPLILIQHELTEEQVLADIAAEDALNEDVNEDVTEKLAETEIEADDAPVIVATTDEASGSNTKVDTVASSTEEAEVSAIVTGLFADEDALRDLVSDLVRKELRGALGEQITRNMRKMVRREIYRTVSARDSES